MSFWAATVITNFLTLIFLVEDEGPYLILEYNYRNNCKNMNEDRNTAVSNISQHETKWSKDDE